LRAFKFLDGFHGNDARAWLLTIGRNTCYTWLQNAKWRICQTNYDQEAQSSPAKNSPAVDLWAVLRHADQELINCALDNCLQHRSLGCRYGILGPNSTDLKTLSTILIKLEDVKTSSSTIPR
jgi:hypothetical protein